MHDGYPAGMHSVSWFKINKIKTNTLISILCIMHFGHEHYWNQACHLGLPHMGPYSGNARSLGHYPPLQITSNKSLLDIMYLLHFTFWALKTNFLSFSHQFFLINLMITFWVVLLLLPSNAFLTNCELTYSKEVLKGTLLH